MIVTCAGCLGELDIADARGPDGAGDFHCTDPVACCDAQLLAFLEAIDGI